MNTFAVGITLVTGSISILLIAYSPGLFCFLAVVIIAIVFLAVLSDTVKTEYPQSKVDGSQSKGRIVNNYGIVHGKADIVNNYGIVHGKANRINAYNNYMYANEVFRANPTEETLDQLKSAQKACDRAEFSLCLSRNPPYVDSISQEEYKRNDT